MKLHLSAMTCLLHNQRSREDASRQRNRRYPPMRPAVQITNFGMVDWCDQPIGTTSFAPTNRIASLLNTIGETFFAPLSDETGYKKARTGSRFDRGSKTQLP